MKCVKGEPDFSFLSIEKLRECERALQNVLFVYDRCESISKDTLEDIMLIRKAFADEAMKRTCEIPKEVKRYIKNDIKATKVVARKIELKRNKNKHLTRK